MVVLRLQRLARMSVSMSEVMLRVEIRCSTYRRLLFSVLASCWLCAEVCPHAAVSTTVDSSTTRRLCVEYWQFSDPSLDAGNWRLVFAAWVPPHQALSIIPIIIIVIVRV